MEPTLFAIGNHYVCGLSLHWGVQNFTGTDLTDRRRRNRTMFGVDHKSRGRRAEVMDISDAGAVMQSELISKNRILTELYIFLIL